jgi:hypothetical protein
MVRYRIKIYHEALQDINQGTDWYNEQLSGLGNRFKKQVISQINKLSTTAQLYTIRYDDVRCMVIKKYPFLVHFTLDNDRKMITIFAVFHTSRNPQIWYERTN